MTKPDFLTSSAHLALPTALPFTAAAQAPLTVYAVTQVNSMMGPAVTTKVYRDGSKALLENSFMPEGAGAKPTHARTLIDLQAGKTISWDADNTAPGGCGTGTFKGDWGDPFAGSASMNADLVKEGAKETGAETIIGISAKVFEVSNPSGTFKAWLDPKTGLLLKLEMSAANAPKRTMIEVKEFSAAKPSAALFVAPAACSQAAADAPPSDLERYAKETGGAQADFANATQNTEAASPNSCTVLFRAVAAGSMQTVTGYKITVDGVSKTADLRNGVLRIDNAAKQFNLDLTNANGGSTALIYRQCPSPQSVLLMVLRNADNWGEGADWMWVKSGKYAN